MQDLFGDLLEVQKQQEQMLLATDWAVDLLDLFRFPVIDAGPRPEACKECFAEYMTTGEAILRNQTLALCDGLDAKLANATDADRREELEGSNVAAFCGFCREHEREGTVLLSYISRSDPVRLATKGCGFS